MRILPFIIRIASALPLCSQDQHRSEVFPGPVSDASFLYDNRCQCLLLVGGSPVIHDSVRSDVWQWNGKLWMKISATGPGSRSFFRGDVDRGRNVVSLFGGVAEVDGKLKGDLWSFDGNKWIKRSTNNIGTRDHHKMVYADHLHSFVLYGGQYDQHHNPDSVTWLLKDGIFTPLRMPGPGVRYHSGMTYDRLRRKIVLYGGGTRPAEHWEFDGIKWEKIVTTENPGRKLYHHMTYDENQKVVILHGGWINQDPRDPANSKTPITWTWDGKTWTRIAEERIFPIAMGYDRKRKVTVAYGFDDVYSNSRRHIGIWELHQNGWKKVADYGEWNTPEYLKRHTTLHPNDVQAWVTYADVLQWQTHEYPEAETVYKKLLKTYPERKNMVGDLVIVLAMQGKLHEADAYIDTIRVSGLLNKGFYKRLAGLLFQQEKYQEAIHYYKAALSIQPEGGDYYELGCAYVLSGQIDLAFASLHKAIDNGYNSSKHFESNDGLESLKSDARWNELMSRLR